MKPKNSPKTFAIAGRSVREVYHFALPLLGIKPWKHVETNDSSASAMLVAKHTGQILHLTGLRSHALIVVKPNFP